MDIGIIDTMKDLIVNFVGAVVFCALGFFYETKTTRKSILMIEPLTDEQMQEYEASIDSKIAADKARAYRKQK